MPPVPEDLKEIARRLDRAEPDVLLLVGTGVSVGATGNDERATWKGLLLDALDRTINLGVAQPTVVQAERVVIQAAFSAPFDLDEILRRAEAITRRLDGANGNHFADWLANSVGKLSIKAGCSKTIDGIAELARTGALVVTTNYDSLLSEATQFPPVTWEDTGKVLDVMKGERDGIIHIHGHWKTPSSIVLGSSSYQRISQAEDFQFLLKKLFLDNHWLYIGCGSGGIDDPNLGALLQWMQAAKFFEHTRRHYFLGSQKTIKSLPRHVRTKQFIAYAYGDHEDLSTLLRQLAPSERRYPFQRVGSLGPRVRQVGESPMSTPLPSWQEYWESVVPELDADAEVAARLCQHGWAMVQDVVSTGKTTLAFRIATTPEFRDAPCYYLSLSQTIDNSESEYGPLAALRRLARPGVLFIIDDIHQNLTLAEDLWRGWRARPMQSRLLLLRTTTQRKIDLTGDSAWLRNQANPAIEMGHTSNDLGAIANCVLNRLGFSTTKKWSFPLDTLDKWHDAYGQSIGAFVVAITQKARQVANGDTELPPSLAATWMTERHLKRFHDTDVANATCLAVFSHKDLELQVPEVSLPHPSRMDRLMASGLAEEHLFDGGRYPLYGLRSTQWGEMILSAVSPRPERLSVLSEAAGKDIALARISHQGDTELKFQAPMESNTVRTV